MTMIAFRLVLSAILTSASVAASDETSNLRGHLVDPRTVSFKDQVHYSHPPAAFKAPQCSPEELTAISTQLRLDSREIRCPDSNWLDRYYQKMYQLGTLSEVEGDEFVGISVGCNKGYDAVNTARMGMGNAQFDKVAWAERTSAGGMMNGGKCKQKDVDQFNLGIEGAFLRRGEMHCIEPMPATARALQSASQDLGLDKEGFVVSQAAISSSDGSIFFPSIMDEGAEMIGLDFCARVDEEFRMKNGCEEVKMYSLQTYVNLHLRSNGPIHILQIDVEGFDFDVLFGAGSVLDRTQYLEFEYHNKGTWRQHHIYDAVMLLDGKGFNCYWEGRDRLWRINGCYLDQFDWHGWSNVACVHRSQNGLADMMEQTFLDTIQESVKVSK